MKNIILVILLIIIAAGIATAQTGGSPGEVVRVEANGGKGFGYPYYIYVPKGVREDKSKVRSLIVIPNNTGTINDDLGFHEADVKKKMPQIGAFLSRLNAVVLMPVFPRSATDHNVYTHSLDRDIFTTDRKEYKRLDLQLLAMIADTQKTLAEEGINLEKQVLMQGYSASGMFVNRFVFLHPEAVKAAIIGAPGGWAIAPVGKYANKELTFPAGVADLKQISGRKFDVKKVREVPLLMILGDQDTNDAVPMGDAYDKTESELVTGLFGKTPVERWPKTVELYRQEKLNATFKLYPGVGHQMNKEMRDDMVAFLEKYVR